MPPRRRSLDTRGRFGRYPPLTKIPRANKSDVAETRAREPRGPVERICRSGNIRPGGYIGAVCGNFAAPFRPPLPWASEPALAKLQGIRIRYRARRHTIPAAAAISIYHHHHEAAKDHANADAASRLLQEEAWTAKRARRGRARRKTSLLPKRAHSPSRRRRSRRRRRPRARTGAVART